MNVELMTLSSFLRLRCPVCEQGRLFHGFFDNPDRCPACGFYFMRENGYFLPHVPIGYGATVFLALSMWPLLKYVFGVRSDAVILTVMVVTAIVFGVWFTRYAKMLWLVFDLYLHPPVTEDFQKRGRT
jgi:uncharacterized protein (DUF983 family)